MTSGFDTLPTRQALANIAKDFHQRGWMAGSAGNLSARASDAENSIWISASGRPKGQLEKSDFLLLDLKSGKTIQRADINATASAESCIHQKIYQLIPDAHACFHIHSVNACLAAELNTANSLSMPLPPLEMIKGLGIWEQDPCVDLPLFDNQLDVSAIARDISNHFKQCPPLLPALMIRNHGITAWGKTLQQAYNHVEIIEFLMAYMARRG